VVQHNNITDPNFACRRHAHNNLPRPVSWYHAGANHPAQNQSRPFWFPQK
jgi:hypothetical protein